MSAAKSGIAIITGFAGGITIVGIATLARFYNQDYEFSHSFDLDFGEDEVGDKRTVYAWGGLYMCSLNFLPRAAQSGDGAGANTLDQAKMSLGPVDKLARVTLTGFDATYKGNGGSTTGMNHARWFYHSGWRLTGSNKGKATWGLTIACSDDPNYDLTAAVA